MAAEAEDFTIGDKGDDHWGPRWGICGPLQQTPAGPEREVLADAYTKEGAERIVDALRASSRQWAEAIAAARARVQEYRAEQEREYQAERGETEWSRHMTARAYAHIVAAGEIHDFLGELERTVPAAAPETVLDDPQPDESYGAYLRRSMAKATSWREAYDDAADACLTWANVCVMQGDSRGAEAARECARRIRLAKAGWEDYSGPAPREERRALTESETAAIVEAGLSTTMWGVPARVAQRGPEGIERIIRATIKRTLEALAKEPK